MSGPRGWGAGWLPVLRLARRDALRARGRSILVLVMIALPVLGVVAADIVIRTVDVSGSEAIERRMGAADAVVWVDPYAGDVAQSIDPERGLWMGGEERTGAPPGLDDVRRVLGRDVPALERHVGSVRVSVDKGASSPEGVELDLSDPLAAGLVELTEGRLPTSRDEVAVNGELAGRGPSLGESLEVAGVGERRVVGLVESTTSTGYPLVFAAPGGLGLDQRPEGRAWLIGGGPVTWDEVRALNGLGVVALSRSVLQAPPPRSELPEEVAAWDSGADGAWIAVVGLIVAMALLEVVLLAGPAFAVTARRQARTIALMIASGATAAQARRVVLANGLVLGSVAALAGVGLGIVAAAVALPLGQRFSGDRFGPFEVAWLDVTVIGLFGVLSAVLAAVVPAWIASRQDVVAVLAGRRGDRAASLRSPLVGVLLLAGGIASAAYGAWSSAGGELFIAMAAIPAVLGMILLVAPVLVGLATVSRRLPLTLRYAVRDAARHRTRTVPAVAAVAATVAGVVALGIANASDMAEARETYQPTLPLGTGALSYQPWASDPGSGVTGRDPVVWARLRAALERELPGRPVREVHGLPVGHWAHFEVGGGDSVLSSANSSYGTELVVADQVPEGLDLGVPVEERGAADAVLARGGAVVFTTGSVAGDRARLVVDAEDPESESARAGTVTVPAHFVDLGQHATVTGIVAPEALEQLGLAPELAGLAVDGPISHQAAQNLRESVDGLTEAAWFYVERGFERDRESVMVLLILGALGGVLMLGGTLTATFLSLSDARPDLATLSAVGAAPRTRRSVAAAYALVVGGVGAVMGAAVGFVPGIAVTYPLTGNNWLTEDAAGNALPTHFLDVPWMLIVLLVVVLPLVTAAIVGLTARSRLPLVARLD